MFKAPAIPQGRLRDRLLPFGVTRIIPRLGVGLKAPRYTIGVPRARERERTLSAYREVDREEKSRP